MKATAAFAAALLIAAPAVAQTAGQTAPRPGSNLTRDLNSAPPASTTGRSAPSAAEPVIRPAPGATAAATETPRPAAAQPPAAAATTPRPAAPPPAAAVAPRSAAPTATTSAPRASTPPPAAARPAAAPAAATTPSAPAAAAPAPAAPAVAPAPAALSPAAIAALPFRVDLPAGYQITSGRPGPDFNIWAIRRGERAFVMIYAGPASQFPIYDGQMIEAAGRASVVVTEDNRRLALEHLFQRPTAPREVHVWVASVEGADRDAAERIAQSIDLR
jgi:hypothetical protein